MTGWLASGRARTRVWAGRWLMLALPLPLLALAAAAFLLAPNSISYRPRVRPDLRLLPSTPRASAPATPGRFAVTGTALSRGERALSRPRRAGQRWPWSRE